MQTVANSVFPCNVVVRYATFHSEPGYAIRTPDRRVICTDHDAQSVMLTNADIAFLVLLGEVHTAEAQALVDFLAGGYAAVACSRRQEVA
jgi:hypothetical protein